MCTNCKTHSFTNTFFRHQCERNCSFMVGDQRSKLNAEGIRLMLLLIRFMLIKVFPMNSLAQYHSHSHSQNDQGKNIFFVPLFRVGFYRQLTLRQLTHMFSMYPLSTARKHKKIFQFSCIFRGQKMGASGTNGLIQSELKSRFIVSSE